MISSIGSVKFIDHINRRYVSKRNTKELVKQALLLISAVSASPKFQSPWLRRFGLDLVLFLQTMLECAPTPSSRRYIASAITGCNVKEWSSPETAENLRELAINWFGHLFWTFKSAGGDGMFSTHDEIHDYFIREEVMQREGNRCLVTGVYDWCRARRHHVPKASLDYACILPRTARVEGHLDESKRTIHDYFTETSWDILQHYVPYIAVNEEQELLDQLESSANAIAMEVDAGFSFQQFLFALGPTEVPDEYVTVAYGDAINDHEVCDIPRLRDRVSPLPHHVAGIPAPCSRFLQVHATIAKVLHYSHAGAAIDRINDFLGPTHPVLQRLDFDSARVTLELGESVERMLAGVSRREKRMLKGCETSETELKRRKIS